MEDSRDVARKCLQELQERSMASRFEVMQDIEVLEAAHAFLPFWRAPDVAPPGPEARADDYKGG